VTRRKVAAVIALTLLAGACSSAAGETRKARKAVATVDRPDAGHRDAPAPRLVVAQSTRLSGEPGGIAVDADGSVVELDEKTVVAYDPDGQEVWSSSVPGAALNWPWIGHGLVVIPTMSAAQLGKYSGADDSGGCVAIDRVSGERGWSYEEQGESGVAVGGVDGLVFCVFDNGVIAALDVDTGTVIWRHVLAPKFAKDISIAERTAIAIDPESGTLMVTAQIVSNWWLALLDVSTGVDRGIWDMDYGGSSSAPVWIGPGRVALGAADPGEVCQLDIHTRTVGPCVAVTAPRGFDSASIPVVANGTLVIAAADGTVTAIDVTKWQVKWSKTFEKWIMDSRVAIVGDVVLGVNWLRVPWALRLSDGSEIPLPDVEGFVSATAADASGGFAVAVRGNISGRIERWSPSG
jgi:outer membrane protein assembly factor BamB